MKLIRFTTADSLTPCFGVVVRDQAVPFAVLQNKAGKTAPLQQAFAQAVLAPKPNPAVCQPEPLASAQAVAEVPRVAPIRDFRRRSVAATVKHPKSANTEISLVTNQRVTRGPFKRLDGVIAWAGKTDYRHQRQPQHARLATPVERLLVMQWDLDLGGGSRKLDGQRNMGVDRSSFSLLR